LTDAAPNLTAPNLALLFADDAATAESILAQKPGFQKRRHIRAVFNSAIHSCALAKSLVSVVIAMPACIIGMSLWPAFRIVE
ncbi:MAG TPA: hypothetical protein PLY87_28665, partial [Planctomycetaceae bacterium]|nr:hypothetical protein [Planctomycetaceae bacterium]